MAWGSNLIYRNKLEIFFVMNYRVFLTKNQSLISLIFDHNIYILFDDKLSINKLKFNFFLEELAQNGVVEGKIDL